MAVLEDWHQPKIRQLVSETITFQSFQCTKIPQLNQSLQTWILFWSFPSQQHIYNNSAKVGYVSSFEKMRDPRGRAISQWWPYFLKISLHFLLTCSDLFSKWPPCRQLVFYAGFNDFLIISHFTWASSDVTKWLLHAHVLNTCCTMHS